MEVDRFRNNKLRCAVIDTNVLMYIFLNKVDVISWLRGYGFSKFIVTESVMDELMKLERSLKGKERIAARFAKNIIERIGFEVVETETSGDTSLIEAAEKFGCVLITNDKELRKKARARKIQVGYLKKDRKLIVEF